MAAFPFFLININFIIISYVFDAMEILGQFIIIKNNNDVTIIILCIHKNVNIIITLSTGLIRIGLNKWHKNCVLMAYRLHINCVIMA